MKKVLRKSLLALIMIVLSTSCVYLPDETEQQEEKRTPEIVAPQKETTERYKIISAHVGNINQLEPYITFCYEKNGEVIFETVSMQNMGTRSSKVYCDIGEENRVIIKTYLRENGTQTKYFITLTREMYEKVYK